MPFLTYPCQPPQTVKLIAARRILCSCTNVLREVHALSHQAYKQLRPVGYPGAIKRMPGRAGTASCAAYGYGSGAAAQRRSGCYVVVSSLSGKYGVPQLSSYSAAKHALHGCFECLRAEVHDRNIRVTIVIPGFIRTPIVQHALTGSGVSYGKTLPAYERGMDPDLCAARILRAVARRKEEALIGGSELSTLYLKRFFPSLLSVLVRHHPVRLRNKLWRLLSLGMAGRDD